MAHGSGSKVLAYYLRGRLSAARVETWRRNFDHGAKWTYYLSMELLPGKLLRTCLNSQGLLELCRGALGDCGVDLDTLWDIEVEPALGNGGLGRLAACLLESMAALGYAGLGYCIRYEYGMFRQAIENGEQVEHPENWLKEINPWEFPRPDFTYAVPFKGRVTQVTNCKGELDVHWSETENVKWKTAIPNRGWSTPVVMGNQVWMSSATPDGHDFFAICVDADSGNIIHDVPLFHSDNPEPLGNGAAMQAPTPPHTASRCGPRSPRYRP